LPPPVPPRRSCDPGLCPLQIVCAEATLPPTLGAVIVGLTALELALEHVPFCTTARNHVSATSGPIVALLKVRLVLAMSVGAVNNASAAFCHLITLPVWPLKTRSAGLCPLQIVCAEATLPPTLGAVIVILTALELALEHVPFCTTARNHVSATNGPKVALLKVRLLLAMSVGAVNNASVAFCHLITLPVWPLKTRSAGLCPLQMVCAEATLPPTLGPVIVILTALELALVQLPFCTTARNHVSATSGPIVALLKVRLVLPMSVG